jgi:hypothetical protein
MGVFIVVLAGCYLWLRPRSQAPAVQASYHFHCSRCKRRIRFLGNQTGKPGQCRRCKERFLFPHPGTQGVSLAREE